VDGSLKRFSRLLPLSYPSFSLPPPLSLSLCLCLSFSLSLFFPPDSRIPLSSPSPPLSLSSVRGSILECKRTYITHPYAFTFTYIRTCTYVRRYHRIRYLHDPHERYTERYSKARRARVMAGVTNPSFRASDAS